MTYTEAEAEGLVEDLVDARGERGVDLLDRFSGRTRVGGEKD
jgi:hypothetical protein